jgi:hypothetical protein
MGIGLGASLDKGMQNGMGMLEQGSALSEEFGPSFGRDIGMGTTGDRATTHAPVTGEAAAVQAAGDPHAGHGAPPAGQAMDHSQHGAHGAQGPPREIGMVPGYPQDMAMVMDEIVAKPETYGLRPTWTIGMMGMMTLVRVLPPEEFDAIQQVKATWKPPQARLDAQKRGWDANAGRAVGASHRSGHENHK